MTRAEIDARAKAKTSRVLDFLAGETWTTAPVLEALLELSSRRTRELIARMVRDGLLQAVPITGFGKLSTVFGITPTGCAFTDAAAGCAHFAGLPPPPLMQRHLDTQRARLRAEAAGWTWTPGRFINDDWQNKPDAVATDPQGEAVAIHITREISTPADYALSIAAALRDIKRGGRYARVQYISPQGIAEAMERAARRAGAPTEFAFANLDDWPVSPAAECQ